MRHEQPFSGKNHLPSDEAAPNLPQAGYTSEHIKSISEAVTQANGILQTIMSERTHLVRAMNRSVSAHLDLERSSERLRKATHTEQEIIATRSSLEHKRREIKREIQRVFPEIYNQVSDLSERIRDLSLTVSGHPSGIRPRSQQDCRLSASEKSLLVVKQHTEKLRRVNYELRSELNRQLEDLQQEEGPSRKGLTSPSLFHFAGSPFESDAVHLAMTNDILQTLQTEIEVIESKYENIHLLSKSIDELESNLNVAQDTVLRERAHRADATLWVNDCDEQFRITREAVHTYLVRAGNCLIETLIQVDAEVHKGKPPKESSFAQTCQALGSLLYVSSSRQSLMGVSDLENKISLLSKTIGALDLEFGLILNPNAESSSLVPPQKRPSTYQVIKVPSEAFQLSGINLLHEHGYRNRESTKIPIPPSRHLPEHVSVVRLNPSHLLIVSELLEQTWQKTLSHNEILAVLGNGNGFGFVALDSIGSLLSVGMADIIDTHLFTPGSDHSEPVTAKVCRLINLTAREEYRKLGYGKIVTHAVLAEAASRGADKAVCSIEAENITALKYLRDKHQFRSLGILTTSNLDEYYVLGRELREDLPL